MTNTTSSNTLRGDIALTQLRELQDNLIKLAKEANLNTEEHDVLRDPDWIDRVIQKTRAAYTITVIGQTSSGKSSFINSLLGRRILVPSDSPTDGVIAVLMEAEPDGPERAEWVDTSGAVHDFTSLEVAMRFLRQQETPRDQQLVCREVRFFLHEPWLRGLRIVNTPGLGDRLQCFEEVTLRYLREDESDLVVWTFFPDTAGNDLEMGVFGSALARRKDSVIGIVTRALEGHHDEELYDPREDPALNGAKGVVNTLRGQLGAYLQDVILYDSHVARRLIEASKENPALLDDDAFRSKLERTGYVQFQDALDRLVGRDRDRVAAAQVQAILKQCIGQAQLLSKTAQRFEAALLAAANVKQEDLQAKKRLEKEIFGPWRVRFKEEVRVLAAERGRELATLLGNAASDCIQENLGLLSSIGRSLASWTRICDSNTVALQKKIEEACKQALEDSRFYERLDRAMEHLVGEHVGLLMSELESLSVTQEDGLKVGGFEHGTASPGQTSPLGEAMVAALKGVISAFLKNLSKNFSKTAAKEVGKKAGGAVLKQGFAKYAGIITLILVPFDLAKLIKDFRKNRDALAAMLRSRYIADQYLYEIRIFDGLWELGQRTMELALAENRDGLEQDGQEEATCLAQAERAAGLSRRFEDLAVTLQERCHG